MNKLRKILEELGVPPGRKGSYHINDFLEFSMELQKSGHISEDARLRINETVLMTLTKIQSKSLEALPNTEQTKPNVRQEVTIMVNTGDDRSVKADKIIGSQIITGDHAKGKMEGVTVKVKLPRPESVNVKAELASLEAVLSTLNAPDQAKIDQAMHDAKEEAAKGEPNKDKIGGAIERAVKYAKGASEFGEHVEKLAPRLAAVTSWLGSNWLKILAMAGLAV